MDTQRSTADTSRIESHDDKEDESKSKYKSTETRWWRNVPFYGTLSRAHTTPVLSYDLLFNPFCDEDLITSVLSVDRNKQDRKNCYMFQYPVSTRTHVNLNSLSNDVESLYKLYGIAQVTYMTVFSSNLAMSDICIGITRQQTIFLLPIGCKRRYVITKSAMAGTKVACAIVGGSVIKTKYTELISSTSYEIRSMFYHNHERDTAPVAISPRLICEGGLHPVDIVNTAKEMCSIKYNSVDNFKPIRVAVREDKTLHCVMHTPLRDVRHMSIGCPILFTTHDYYVRCDVDDSDFNSHFDMYVRSQQLKDVSYMYLFIDNKRYRKYILQHQCLAKLVNAS